jgi:hypothetical protein
MKKKNIVQFFATSSPLTATIHNIPKSTSFHLAPFHKFMMDLLSCLLQIVAASHLSKGEIPAIIVL